MYNYILCVERNGGKSVKRVHIYSVMKYICTLQTLSRSSNIHTTTSAYTPESNGKSERINRTLLDKIRAMMKEAGFHNAYRAEAMYQAVYLSDRTRFVTVVNRTPYERLFETRASLKILKIFDCAKYTHIHEPNR